MLFGFSNHPGAVVPRIEHTMSSGGKITDKEINEILTFEPAHDSIRLRTYPSRNSKETIKEEIK